MAQMALDPEFIRVGDAPVRQAVAAAPIQDAPVVNTGKATRLVRMKRPDGSLLQVREFIPHDSRPRFGRLNHIQTDALQPAKPENRH
jgi:hypothetical protein